MVTAPVITMAKTSRTRNIKKSHLFFCNYQSYVVLERRIKKLIVIGIAGASSTIVND